MPCRFGTSLQECVCLKLGHPFTSSALSPIGRQACRRGIEIAAFEHHVPGKNKNLLN
jgi:hypothetical protein